VGDSRFLLITQLPNGTGSKGDLKFHASLRKMMVDDPDDLLASAMLNLFTFIDKSYKYTKPPLTTSDTHKTSGRGAVLSNSHFIEGVDSLTNSFVPMSTHSDVLDDSQSLHLPLLAVEHKKFSQMVSINPLVSTKEECMLWQW
jgi:hypothetical protein